MSHTGGDTLVGEFPDDRRHPAVLAAQIFIDDYARQSGLDQTESGVIEPPQHWGITPRNLGNTTFGPYGPFNGFRPL